MLIFNFSKNLSITSAISSRWFSSAKCPPSTYSTCAFFTTDLNASAPAGMKIPSFFPQIARTGGWWSLRYFWNIGYNSTFLR